MPTQDRESQKEEQEGPSRPTLARARAHFDEFISRRVLENKETGEYRLSFPGEYIINENGESRLVGRLRNLLISICSLHTMIPQPDRYSFFGSAKQLDEFGIGISLYFLTLKGIAAVTMVCAFISLVAIQQNKTFNDLSSDAPAYTGNATCPTQLLGSAYGATRSDLRFAKQGASDIAVVVVMTLFLILAGHIEAILVEKIGGVTDTVHELRNHR